MGKHSAIFGIGVLAGCALGGWLLLQPGAERGTPAVKPRALPFSTLHFERNDGQVPGPAQLIARGQGYALLLEPQQATLALRTESQQLELLRLQLVGASANASLEGQQQLPGRVNYLVGGPARWRSGIPAYAQARAREVYAGIDLLYYGSGRRLEYDFIVAPGADPDQIRLRFAGAQHPQLDDDGALRLTVGEQEVTQHAPFIYQQDGEARVRVDGGYVVAADGTVGFEVAAYDTTRALVIDPVLAYSTLLGGSNEDIATAVTTDAAGNAYVVGLTHSVDMPATEGAYDTTSSSQPDYYWSDAFVAKFDTTGSQLVYLTYFGSSGAESARAVAVDALGQAHVAGYAELGGVLPTPGAYGSGSGYCNGGFVTKLSSDGSGLLYVACFADASANALALDSDGLAHVGGSAFGPDRDKAFIAKLSNDGAQLEYLKTFGNSAVLDLAVDALGNVYATGSAAAGFPATAGAYDTTYGGGGGDAFVAKLDPSGTDFIYATLLGGSDADGARGIAIDAEGNAYIAGNTGIGASSDTVGDFPTTPGAYRPDFDGGIDGFAAKIDASGANLTWSTFINSDPPFGYSFEEVDDIALSPAGLPYVVGAIGSDAPFPVTPGAFDESPSGPDGFLLLLRNDGSDAIYASYVGGGATDQVYGVAVDAAGSAYLAGATWSSGDPFETTSGAYDSTHNGGSHDAFIVKLQPLVDSVASFPVATLEVAADATAATVEVVREGDASGTFQVDYSAVTDAANAVVAAGTLVWADGESGAQQLEIPLPASGTTQAKSAGPSSVVVALAQPNGRLGARRSMTLKLQSGGSGSGGAFGAWLLLLALAAKRGRQRLTSATR